MHQKSYKSDGFWRHTDVITNGYFNKKNQRLCSCKIRSLSLSFCHFGVRRVNTTRNNRLVNSYVWIQTSKIWCNNIHALLRNCGFRVGAFYFDAPCRRAWPLYMEVRISTSTRWPLGAYADKQNLMRGTLGCTCWVWWVWSRGAGLVVAGPVVSGEYRNADLAPDNFQGTTSLR